MRYDVRKLPPAEWDLLEAVVWYGEHDDRLADAFLDEVDKAIQKLQHQPEIYGARFEDVRRVRLRRFKDYGVYYVMKENEV